MASPQSSKGIAIGRISSGGSSVAGAAKRGRFGGGGGGAWWSLGCICLHLERACVSASYWPARRPRVTRSNSGTCYIDRRKWAAHSALCTNFQLCSRVRIHAEYARFSLFCRDARICRWRTLRLQKAEHKNTAQNLGRQYKVSPRPVPMPAIEADPALQESHGCPPATRTQSQHIAVNRRD